MLSEFTYLFKILDSEEKRNLIIYSVLSIFTPVVDLFSISMMLPIMNQMMGVPQISKKLAAVLLGINVLVIFKGLFELYKSRTVNRLLYNGTRKLSEKLYELLMKEDLLKHYEREIMQFVTLIRGDSAACLRLLISEIDVVSAGLTIAGFFSVILLVAGVIGLLGCIGFTLSMVLVYLFYKKNIKTYGEEKRKYEIRMNAQITVAYSMFKVFKLDDCWKAAMRRYKNYSRKFAQVQEEYTFKSTIVSVFLNNMIQAAFFLWLTFSIVFEMNLTDVIVRIVVFITLLIRMLPVGSSFIKGLHSIEFEQKAYESFRVNMEAYKDMKWNEESREGLRKKEITINKGLKIQHVTFAYRNGQNIFTDISVDLPAGKSIAIIGPSGSGKTTFLDLVLGLLKPQKGNIYYDDYDIVTGTDGQGKCQGLLGTIVSYIPQMIYLNGETVRNNVAFFSDEIDDERVRQSLAVAQVLEEVEKLPDGIYNMIGEHGATISGGQRQRIALARALYKDFKLLVMDEATAALDMDTENAVIDSIRQIKKDRTLLVVTHHMNLAKECDLIYKIENQSMIRIR